MVMKLMQLLRFSDNRDCGPITYFIYMMQYNILTLLYVDLQLICDYSFIKAIIPMIYVTLLYKLLVLQHLTTFFVVFFSAESESAISFSLSRQNKIDFHVPTLPSEIFESIFFYVIEKNYLRIRIQRKKILQKMLLSSLIQEFFIDLRSSVCIVQHFT